jgi:hypothetical protein
MIIAFAKKLKHIVAIAVPERNKAAPYFLIATAHKHTYIKQKDKVICG